MCCPESDFSRVPRERLRGRLRFAPGSEPLTVEIAEFWLSLAVLKSRFLFLFIGVDTSSRVLSACVSLSLVVHSSSNFLSSEENFFTHAAK